MCVQVLYYIKNLFSYFMNKKCKLFLPVHIGDCFNATFPRTSLIARVSILSHFKPHNFKWKLIEKELFMQNDYINECTEKQMQETFLCFKWAFTYFYVGKNKDWSTINHWMAGNKSFSLNNFTYSRYIVPRITYKFIAEISSNQMHCYRIICVFICT